MSGKTAFIIPCYNEEQNIEDLISSCKRIIINSEKVIEFILVNNGSKDLTANKIELGISPQIHFVNIDENIGMGNGIKKGLEFAIKSQNYKNFGWTHADLQIPQESLIKALKLMDDEEMDSKKIYIRGRRINRNNFDVIFTFLMSCYTSILKRGLYYDITGLPVLINNSLINKVVSEAPSGFAFDVFTYIKAKRAGGKVIRFNVNFAARTKGKSSWNTGFMSKLKMCKYYIREIWKI
tara:strand:- start:1192 stop:1902 length:711 start_codon:yes stop_codon:yes gene_type:complete